jgi:16S rRNA processing protein RimM
MEALQTGTIIKTVGLKGELKLKSTTFFAEERYQKGNKVYLSKDGKNFQKCTVLSYRFYQGFDFVILKEISSIEAAENYIGYNIYVNKEDAVIDDDMYFFCDLEGCKVFNEETKEEIGIVNTVEEFPAQITLAVKSNKTGKIFFVPFVNAFIGEIDIKKKEIYIKVIEGLIE